LSPFAVLGGLALFFLSALAGDYLRARRIHPLTAALAVLLFLFLPIEAIIGDSAGRLARTVETGQLPVSLDDSTRRAACPHFA
jgi:hypothetical protein